MIPKRLRDSIDVYIKEYYVPIETIISDRNEKTDVTKEAKSGTGKVTLDQLMEEIGESFQEKLFSLIDKSGMTDVEVYKRAGIDRKLFSKIRSNPMYHPKKQTVLALAIALRLDIRETVDLLASAEYALSPGSKGDLIVKYFIEQKVYDIMTINFALDEYGEHILG